MPVWLRDKPKKKLVILRAPSIKGMQDTEVLLNCGKMEQSKYIVAGQ